MPTRAEAGPSSIPLRAAAASQDAPAYRLLELPDEIAHLIEEAQRKDLEKRRSGGRRAECSGKRRRSHSPTGGTEEERPHLVINGRHHDEAVLCTESRTYALREVSQSNSLLLCSINRGHPDGTEKRDKAPTLVLHNNISSLLEMAPVVPRLERISSLLKDSMYAGDDAEQDKKNQRRYTPREVRSVVQASDAELQEGYDARHVVLLDGFMRLVSPPYLKTVLRSLILIVESNSYLPHKLPLEEVTKALLEDHAGSIRREVVQALLTRWFGKVVVAVVVQQQQGDGAADTEQALDVEESQTSPDATRVCLDGEKIARFFGQQILKETSRRSASPSRQTHTEFMDSWRRLMGDAFHPDPVSLDLLKGQYLLHPAPSAQQPRGPSSEPLTISYYPASELPLDPPARFQELFLTRPSWTLPDLEPYLQDVAYDAKRREALLLRFARAKKVKIAVAHGAASSSSKGRADARQPTEEITLYSARVRY